MKRGSSVLEIVRWYFSVCSLRDPIFEGNINRVINNRVTWPRREEDILKAQGKPIGSLKKWTRNQWGELKMTARMVDKAKGVKFNKKKLKRVEYRLSGRILNYANG